MILNNLRIYEEFLGCLKRATAAIESEYFFLPIAGSQNLIYRERIYCYELYYQLRSQWGRLYDYSIGGEVDKTGHPIMNTWYIKNTKPDLLIHKPGDMSGNFIIIEVKSVKACKSSIKKDLRTLTAYQKHANYQHSIYLIYGSENEYLERIKRKSKEVQDEDGEGLINLELIDLYWHSSPGTEAEKVNW